MKNKFQKFLLLSSFSFLFIFFPTKCYADIGWLPQPGGTIVTGDAIKDIEMTSEDVLYDIEIINKEEESSDGISTSYISHVKAVFDMTNLSSQDKTADIMFPYHDPYGEINKERIENIYIKVNGSTVKYGTGSFSYTNDLHPDWQQSGDVAYALTFNTTFKANSVTTIEITYDLHMEYAPKTNILVLYYIMSTGSNWEGSIGEGKFTVRFPFEGINEYVFEEYNDFFKISGNELVWEFENLEPTKEDDISIKFRMDGLEIFNNRQSFIRDVRIQGNSILDVNAISEPFYVSRQDGSGYLLIYGSKVGMLNYEGEKDCFTPYVLPLKLNKENTSYIEYEFNETYPLYYLYLKTYNEIAVISNETPFFEGILDRTFSSPSSVRVTFSDGSKKTFEISSNDQIIDLQGKRSSSVKVEFLDLRPGLEKEGEEFFLIDYLGFSIDNKIQQFSKQSRPEQVCDFENSKLYYLEMFNNIVPDQFQFIEDINTNTNTENILNMSGDFLLIPELQSPFKAKDPDAHLVHADLLGLYDVFYEVERKTIPSGWLFQYDSGNTPYVEFKFKEPIRISRISLYPTGSYWGSYEFIDVDVLSRLGDVLGEGVLSNILGHPNNFRIILSDGYSIESNDLLNLEISSRETTSLKIEILGIEEGKYESYEDIVFVDCIEIETNSEISENKSSNHQKTLSSNNRTESIIKIILGAAICVLVICFIIKWRRKGFKNLTIVQWVDNTMKKFKEKKKT